MFLALCSAISLLVLESTTQHSGSENIIETECGCVGVTVEDGKTNLYNVRFHSPSSTVIY